MAFVFRHQPRKADVTDNAKKLLTIPDFTHRYSVGRSKAYKLIGEGAISAVKVGRSTRITSESAENWFRSLPDSDSDPT